MPRTQTHRRFAGGDHSSPVLVGRSKNQPDRGSKLEDTARLANFGIEDPGRCASPLDFYMEKIYPRHLNSFPLFGIEAHGFWTAKDDVEPRLFVLASYAAGEDPGEVAKRYMQSAEFADDTRDFNVSDIVGVESTILIPSTSSPLK